MSHSDIFEADDHTKRCLDMLFTAAQRAAGQETDADPSSGRGVALLNVDRLPTTFQNEFQELFGESVTLKKSELGQGLNNVAEAYMSGAGRAPRINGIRNSCFRMQLFEHMGRELELKNDDRERLNMDRETIEQARNAFEEQAHNNNTTTHRGDNSNNSNNNSSNNESLVPLAAVGLRQAPPLLRSDTTGHREVSGQGRSAITDHLDNASLDLWSRAMSTRDKAKQEDILNLLSSLVSQQLRELPEVQHEANMYLQRKIKGAMDALRLASTSSPQTTPFSLNERVIFTTDTYRSCSGVIAKVHSNSTYDVQLEQGGQMLPQIGFRDLERASSADGRARLEATRFDRSAEVGQGSMGPGGTAAAGVCAAGNGSSLLAAGVNLPEVSWEDRYIASEAALLPYLQCSLLPEHVPPTWGTQEQQDYHLWFKIDGRTKTEFHFLQQDIGLSYRLLLQKSGVPADVLDAHPAAVGESNRCFFLHLGLATGLNPFVMQACFRRAARTLLQENSAALAAAVAAAEAAPGNSALEERATELALSAPDYLFEPVLRRSEYVEFDMLAYLWPVEMERFRICLVPIDWSGALDTIICYTPHNSPYLQDGRWTGEDVIIKKESNHFTVLAKSTIPKYNYGSASLIDKFLGFMEKFGKPVVHRGSTVNRALSMHALTPGKPPPRP